MRPPALLLLLLLCCCCLLAGAQEAPEKLFVSVWPEKPVVAFGSSVVVNCSTNCEDISSGGLETHLEKQDAGQGATWRAFRLVNISHWDPVPSCFFDCRSGEVMPHRVNFTVYRVPERVVLDPVPVMEEGKEYTLKCTVFDVAPVRNLSVAFLRGGKELHLETFEKHADRQARDVAVSHTLTARRADQGEEISCRAALDLTPEGPRFEKASLNQSLQTVVFPVNPELGSASSMELRTAEVVTCEVTGVFPAEEAQFSLTFAGENLSPSVNVSGDTARAQAQVLPSLAGDHLLKCTVSLGPVTRFAEMNVYVYSFPDLTLTVDPPETLVNESVTVACSDSRPGDTHPQSFSAQIRTGKRVLGSGHGLPLEVAQTVGEEDDGQEFTCEVELELNGTRVRRTKSAALTVYYGPRMDDSSCPRTVTWKEGSKENLTCAAWGNPLPRVECRKDGALYRAGEPIHVTRGHQGRYNCSASNEHGSAAIVVTVRVESDEPPILIIFLVILGLVIIASAAGVGYYMYYKSHKIKKYRLRRKAGGNPTEEKSLNGNVQTDSV